jgi:hypothetical protein
VSEHETLLGIAKQAMRQGHSVEIRPADGVRFDHIVRVRNAHAWAECSVTNEMIRRAPRGVEHAVSRLVARVDGASEDGQ